MCGIVGIIDTRERRPIDRTTLIRMNEAQHHRGPDEDGLHLAPGVALGHKRLSIIDLATGQQPLFNEDGSVVVVYNGEIYNYQELIPELTALGHVFRTRSDTEVIVHAWEQWGEDSVTRFRGMFAFALWDERRQTLFLARDRLGVKPLYYALLPDGHLIFGSELKALLAHGGLRTGHRCRAPSRSTSRSATCRSLRPSSPARYKLPPGHTLTIRRGEPVGEPREYWDVSFTLDATHQRRGRTGRTDRTPARVRPAAHDLRGAAGRVPVRRRRLQRGRGDDGRLVRRAGQYLLDLLLRSGLRRIALRAAGRRPLRHAPLRRSRRKRRLRSDRYAGGAVRRTLCRQLGDSDVSRLRAGAHAT